MSARRRQVSCQAPVFIAAGCGPFCRPALQKAVRTFIRATRALVRLTEAGAY